jgi:flagellar biosynthetic protein FliR
MLAGAMVLALCIAAPVCIALLVVDLALGMIGKTIPQISFMSVGMSLRCAAALVTVILGLGVTATVLGGALTDAMRLAQAIGASP